MSKFIHICASQDDVFALDDQGDVYRFNFNVKEWVKLVADRHAQEGTPEAGGWSIGDGTPTRSPEPARPSQLLGPSARPMTSG